jgi:hypothetical protein
MCQGARQISSSAGVCLGGTGYQPVSAGYQPAEECARTEHDLVPGEPGMMQRRIYRRTPGAGCPRERAGSPFHREFCGSADGVATGSRRFTPSKQLQPSQSPNPRHRLRLYSSLMYLSAASSLARSNRRLSNSNASQRTCQSKCAASQTAFCQSAFATGIGGG